MSMEWKQSRPWAFGASFSNKGIRFWFHKGPRLNWAHVEFIEIETRYYGLVVQLKSLGEKWAELQVGNSYGAFKRAAAIAYIVQQERPDLLTENLADLPEVCEKAEREGRIKKDIRIALFLGRFKRAAALARKTLRNHPEDKDARISLVQSLRITGHHTRALIELGRYNERYPNDLEASVALLKVSNGSDPQDLKFIRALSQSILYQSRDYSPYIDLRLAHALVVLGRIEEGEQIAMAVSSFVEPGSSDEQGLRAVLECSKLFKSRRGIRRILNPLPGPWDAIITLLMVLVMTFVCTKLTLLPEPADYFREARTRSAAISELKTEGIRAGNLATDVRREPSTFLSGSISYQYQPDTDNSTVSITRVDELPFWEVTPLLENRQKQFVTYLPKQPQKAHIGPITIGQMLFPWLTDPLAIVAGTGLAIGVFYCLARARRKHHIKRVTRC